MKGYTCTDCSQNCRLFMEKDGPERCVEKGDLVNWTELVIEE